MESCLLESVPFAETFFLFPADPCPPSVGSVGRVFVVFSLVLVPAGSSCAESCFSGDGFGEVLERGFAGSLVVRKRLPGSKFLTTPVHCRLDTTYVDGYEQLSFSFPVSEPL